MMREKKFYLDRLQQAFGKEKPLARMLRTSSGYYVYDTGTNKILECRKEVYDLIQELFVKDVNKAAADFISRWGENEFLAAADEIVEAMDTEKILVVKKATKSGLSDHFKDFKKMLTSSVKAINLEVTQDCTLRCAYCIYQDHFKEKRNYSQKVMGLDVGKKAIELLKAHSSALDTVSIGFYGGEPLMRFPFIKDCVEYAKKLFTGEKIGFNITTNATLITDEVAEYLIKEGFFVMVSLDGPKAFHDKFRKDAKGHGSFDKTLNGLRLLSEKYRETKKGTIALNLVYTPPFSEHKLDTTNNYFKELKWLPKEVPILTHYPVNNSIPAAFAAEADLKEDKYLFDWAVDKYKVDPDKSDSMVKGQIEERFAKFMQRPVLTEPVDSYFLNGCCIPGLRKNYITTNGDIQLCEKMPGNCPAVGNVNTGFDFETIKNIYIDEYVEKSIDTCSRCWGLRLCDVCYVYAFNERGELDMKKKSGHCQTVLNNVEKCLLYFVTLMEENPGKLDYLYQFDIK